MGSPEIVWQASLPQFSALKFWVVVVLRSPIHANEPSEYNGMLYRTSNRVLNNGIKVIILICMDGTSQYHHHQVLQHWSYIHLKSQISGKFAFQRLKITEQTFTLASLIVSYHVGPWSPGGYSAENGVQLCPDPSLKPPFQNFLVPQDPTLAWNHKFLENLHFKGSKLRKSSVLMPNIRSTFSFKSLKLDKKSVMTPNLAEVFFFFFTLWATHTYQKRKLRTPPMLDHSWFNTGLWCYQPR